MDLRPEEINSSDRGAEDAFERELIGALRHTDAPAGFADRVMARAKAVDGAPESQAAVSRGKVLQWPVLRPWLGGAVAAVLIAGLFATESAVEHHRARERRVQQATEQFETAERITDRALEQARRQIQQAGVPLD